MMKLVTKTIERDWKYKEEKSYKAISFSIEGRDSEILMTEDLDYNNSHDLHPIDTNKLNEEELRFLVQSIIEFLPPSHYLLTCGESWKDKEDLFRILTYSILSETECVRVLLDKEGNKHYYQIFEKQSVTHG